MIQVKNRLLTVVAGDGQHKYGDGLLFEAPPQGNPRISQLHAEQLTTLCEQILIRTQTVYSIICSPHRVGHHCCMAIKLVGQSGSVNLLLTITGTLRWPTQQEYAQAYRWYINLPDAVDATYLVMVLEERLGRGIKWSIGIKNGRD